jgi:hypothetical protein
MDLTTTVDYYINSSTLSSVANGDYLLSTTEKPFAESINETFQKVITTKDMVSADTHTLVYATLITRQLLLAHCSPAFV